jgi:hypothetical protein
MPFDGGSSGLLTIVYNPEKAGRICGNPGLYSPVQNGGNTAKRFAIATNRSFAMPATGGMNGDRGPISAPPPGADPRLTGT